MNPHEQLIHDLELVREDLRVRDWDMSSPHNWDAILEVLQETIDYLEEWQ